jgi:3-hydroxyisobutyrate dehydrogenase
LFIQGVTPATSLADVAKDVDYIVTSLPRTKDIETVLYAKDGIFESASPGTYITDSSTISPYSAKQFHEDSLKYGLKYIDTPMSGGINGAVKSTLTFMVGTGDQNDFEKVSIVLNGMGKKLFMCGGPGTGEIAKLANNMILGITMIAASEGMALGEKLGIDPKVLSEILGVSTGSCYSITTANPRPGNIPTSPASNNYDGGF